MEVKVVPYNPDWERMYRQESFCLRNILRNELVAIYHIGSTSVPGLAAKPIIDIMPVVKDINRIDRLNLEFERLGYECMGSSAYPDAVTFVKEAITVRIRCMCFSKITVQTSTVIWL